jgi:hypothetical protein
MESAAAGAILGKRSNQIGSPRIAVLQLLYTEAMLPSGFFLKKKPPSMILARLYLLENRSRGGTNHDQALSSVW